MRLVLKHNRTTRLVLLQDACLRYTSTVLILRKILGAMFFAGICVLTYGISQIGTSVSYATAPIVDTTNTSVPTIEEELIDSPSPSPVHTPTLNTDVSQSSSAQTETPSPREKKHTIVTESSAEVFSVPFYSQFTDITPVAWKKIGCGVASLAMLIEFYKPGTVVVDTLLQEGISADAYLQNAGWTYAGLIGISKKYGLGGMSHDIAGMSMDAAFTKLESALEEGPVMVSVHYTFDPKNPIPHLVVATGVKDDMVYYNDPADVFGGGSVSITQFKSAWKKRYIEIRPT